MSEAQIRANEIIDRVGKGSVGAEIGVAIGQTSECLLKSGVKHLYMVDSWAAMEDQPQHYIDSGDWHATCTQQEQDAHYRAALEITEFAQERRTVLRQSSLRAARETTDKSLDFVFIDADHSYRGCLQDIEAWKGKVKPGGWLCGHDYGHTPTDKEWTWGPKKAVDEAVEKYGWKLQIGANYTWFCRMEKT